MKIRLLGRVLFLVSVFVKRGGQINGCVNSTGKVERRILPKHTLAIFICAILFSLNSPASESTNIQAATAAKSPQFKQPATLKELLASLPAELEKCDLARMNLLCAEGLSGSENLNVDESLATLDQWAQHVKSETDRNFHRFRDNPADFNNSEGY
ncbi:MAG: hypothetical protein WBN75_01990 [Verrucomicrobiia bacterium]